VVALASSMDAEAEEDSAHPRRDEL
jgi:hypothetical protein